MNTCIRNRANVLVLPLAKGQNYCWRLGKNFAAIDQRSGYSCLNPNLKTAVNMAAMLGKAPICGMGRRSGDWRIQMAGIFQ